MNKKLNNYPKLYCNICGDTNHTHGFYPLLTSNGISCSRCGLSDEEYENAFGCKKEIIENVCKIHQKDLHKIYNSINDVFKLDEFEFIGEDNNIYIFDVTQLEFLCDEYGQESIWDMIREGGIDSMIFEELCKLK